MLRKGRIVAAALAGVGAAGFFVMVVVPGAGGKSSQTTVTLQLAPRGLGSVSANPPGLDSDNQPVSECTRNYAQHACEWRYARGTAVTLTAKPDAAAGRSLASWSTADCPGKGACRVVLDDDLTSVVALMTPLRLAVRLSNAEAGSVRMDPAGADCRGTLQDPAPNVCRELPRAHACHADRTTDLSRTHSRHGARAARRSARDPAPSRCWTRRPGSVSASTTTVCRFCPRSRWSSGLASAATGAAG
jgi:hypothetical protein